MINFKEELKYYKQEKDRIKSEISDLETRIIVESGRHHRYEVNHYRNRINRLKMRLNEISLKIVDLEKKIAETESDGQIQVIPNDLNLHSTNGEVAINDSLESDCVSSGETGEVIQTVVRTYQRTIRCKNGNLVSITENFNETVKTQKLKDSRENFIETSIAH